MRRDNVHRQAIVIGSGFGGSMAAWALIHEGVDVCLLERGGWVPRGPENWNPEGTILRTPFYNDTSRYLAQTDSGSSETGSCACVGGPSVFYGGVSLRYRQADFEPDPEIARDSGARWPFSYAELQPFYAEAERVLGVAGRAGDDPTEPPRREAYPAPPAALSEVSAALAGAARSLGLHPFRLPLAIDYGAPGSRTGCIECATCDTFACGVEAKNDLAVRVIPVLVAKGMELRPETAVTRLCLEGGRIAAVECRDRRSGELQILTADVFVLAAGALGTAHLLLASGLADANPAGDSVGRYLMRHCSGIVFGAYRWIPKYEGRFHKQIGINDYYFGDPDGPGPPGKLGNIQQTQTPSMGTVRGETGPLAGRLLTPLVRRATGLLVIAEDRPRPENRVYLDTAQADELGLPRLRIEHRYDSRDLDARRALARRAKRIHRAAGSPATYLHEIDTFSHALGTVRMGPDRESDPLDRDGRFRGVANLYVTDGSALPTSAGVNPSLTIAANALRVGRSLGLKVRSA